MKEFQDFLGKLLNKLGFLNDDQKLSLTNVTVYVFLVITAFRGLFGGAVFTFADFKWSVQTIDFASTLPLLFALINYSSKRVTLSNNNKPNPGKDESNAAGA